MLVGRAARLGTDLESANPDTNLKRIRQRECRRGWFEDSFLKCARLKGLKQLQQLDKKKVNFTIVLKTTQQLYNLTQQKKKSMKLHCAQK